MDYDAARFWFDIVQSIFMFGVAVYAWWGNRRRVTQKAIDDLNKFVSNVASGFETRVVLLERFIESLPTNKERNNELGQIHRRVDEMGQGLTRVEGQMSQVNATLSLIQSYLLERKE